MKTKTYYDNEEEKQEPLWLSLVSLLFLPLFIWWRGIVLAQLWAWFMVPLAVVPIGAMHAMGLVSIFDLVKWKWGYKTEDKLTTSTTTIISGVLGPAMALGVGWIYHWLM